MLREVETNLFAISRHTHGDEMVNKFVAQPTHGEGVYEDNDDSQQVVEENNKALPCSGDESLLNEDTREYGTKDTACAVGGEYVEGIIDAGM